MPSPVWVNTLDGLRRMCADLLAQPRIAVDTESNSLHAYREQVCLIQFSTPGTDYLVDPLELHDLTPLADIFSSAEIEKVFHAVEYDLIGLHRDFDFTFANIFDTMLAARILGLKQLGLGSLLAEKFNIEVDKRYQKADWGARPLPPDLVDYARLDTHYLLALRDMLEAELKEKDRWTLASEDFLRICYTNNGLRVTRERWERIDGQQDLSQRGKTILNELCLSREKIAERLNRPVFKVIDDRLLLKLSQLEPASLSELAQAGLTERQVERFGRPFLEAVQRGKNSPLVIPTGVEKPPESVLNRLHLLKNWRKKKAEEVGVESDIILPRPYLFQLAESNPRTPEALSKIMADSPWRLENHGPEILRALGVKGSGA